MKATFLTGLVPAALLGTLLLQSAAPAQYYPGPRRDRGGFAQGGQVRWSGDVDDTVTVSIHAGDVRTRTVQGRSAGNVNTQVEGRLPDRPARVFLQRQDGRGEIRVVQQPNPSNNFTARVRIHDPRPGSDHYSFVLAWQPNGPRGGRGGF